MIFYLSAFLVFLVDRATKYFTVLKLHPGDSFPLLPEILHLTYIQNRGAAFGIFQEKTNFFVLATLVVVGVLIWVQYRYNIVSFLLKISLGLIFGGAVGNLWDRLLYGYVVDMFDFRVWPVFNVADTAIVSGVFILSWFILREPGLWKEEKQSGTD